MISEYELDAAIAECRGERNPNANTCIKLAAFYTIKRELYGEEKQAVMTPAYSYAPAPDRKTIEIDGDSEFARAIDGREQSEILPVLDELMQTLNVIQPRLYNAVMDKLA